MLQKPKIVTVKETITRDEFLHRNEKANDVLASRCIFTRLRSRGVPLIGCLGVLAVEWGTLTITAQDGLDGDEWVYEWTGEQLPDEWVKRISANGKCLFMHTPLRQMMADEDEL